MKNHTPLLAVLLFSLSQTAILAEAGQTTPEEIYNGLQGELSVQLNTQNGPIVGTEIRQKNNPAGKPAFCRRSNPVVPNPTYTYVCYYQTVGGVDAEALYNQSKSNELGVLFRSTSNGGILVGSSWSEKELNLAGASLCVKTAPVVPHAVAAYACYSNLPGVGGAISGGN